MIFILADRRVQDLDEGERLVRQDNSQREQDEGLSDKLRTDVTEEVIEEDRHRRADHCKDTEHCERNPTSRFGVEITGMEHARIKLFITALDIVLGREFASGLQGKAETPSISLDAMVQLAIHAEAARQG